MTECYILLYIWRIIHSLFIYSYLCRSKIQDFIREVTATVAPDFFQIRCFHIHRICESLNWTDKRKWKTTLATKRIHRWCLSVIMQFRFSSLMKLSWINYDLQVCCWHISLTPSWVDIPSKSTISLKMRLWVVWVRS